MIELDAGYGNKLDDEIEICAVSFKCRSIECNWLTKLPRMNHFKTLFSCKIYTYDHNDDLPIHTSPKWPHIVLSRNTDSERPLPFALGRGIGGISMA